VKKQGFIGSLVLGAVGSLVAATMAQQITPKSIVSLKEKSIRLDYALTEPGPVTLELISMNGKTLGKWRWEDSTSGVFFRDLSLNGNQQNQSVFVVVNGPDLTSIQGLYTGDTTVAAIHSTISNSLPLNDKPQPDDFNKSGATGYGHTSPYGP